MAKGNQEIVAGNEMYIPKAKARGPKTRKAENCRGIIALAGLAAIAFGVIFGPDIKTGIDFRVARRQVLEQYHQAKGYASFVSPEEEQELFSRIFANEDIRFDFNNPAKAKDYLGRRVPVSELTKILNKYLGNEIGIEDISN